jgi:HlyD family secretion protein
MATPSEKIFREVAIERLSSPEQLDRLIRIASPIGWVSTAAVAMLLAAIVCWGIFGSVPTRVQGQGILVTRGGQLFDAMASAPGTLATVVPIGTRVQPGDVVATLDDTQTEQDLAHARNVLREQEGELQQVTERFDREIAARRQVDAQQRDNLQQAIAAAEQRRVFYQQALASEAPVVERGFITRRFEQETRQQMEAAEEAGQRARNDLLRLDADELDQRDRRDQEVWRQQEAVNTARRALEELQIRTSRSTQVVSPIAGKVTEIKAAAGTVVAPGKPILSIETAGEGLELALYVPPEQGKTIAPGMEVRIEPATIKKEEFGTLIGRVIDISQFPVSAEGMMAVLQNAQLVTRFSAEGAPYAARVRLVADPAAPSGYAWAAGHGPPLRLSSGTTADAEVTVRRQRPITLVLPLLRGVAGVGG